MEKIEDVVGAFLSSNNRGKREFSEAFCDQIPEVQNYALIKGYVAGRGNPEIPFERTSLGRTFADSYTSTHASVPSH
jgi:hypothetical protein